jgi:hypothetical protein
LLFSGTVALSSAESSRSCIQPSIKGIRRNAPADRAKQETTMSKSRVTTTAVILAALAAGLILVVATDGSLARVNTGTRPTSTGASSGFGINAGAGKGVGADGGVAMGGSSGAVVPKPPRFHHPFPPRD